MYETPIGLLILTITAFIAGLIDSIAGGGGLITIPVFLAMGMPPHLALGTNKMQAVFGSASAFYSYKQHGLVEKKGLIWGIACTAIGAGIGTVLVSFIDSSILRTMIPLLLASVFFYLLLQQSPWSPTKALKTHAWDYHIFYTIFGLAIGFYDGFFGPGTGTLWASAFLLFFIPEIKRATGTTKAMNFTSNLISLITFLLLGHVLLLPALFMAGAQVAGAFTGSKLVVRFHSNFVRYMLLGVAGLTVLNEVRKLIWQ
jgi:uncharacterized membrane protein YfcA